MTSTPSAATPPDNEDELPTQRTDDHAPPADLADGEPTQFVLTLPDDSASGKDWYLWAGVLALLVFVAFFPAASGKFLWDDDHHVGVISSLPTLKGLVRIWTQKGATPQYYPLTFTSFWIEHRLWKESPLGYHLGNLALHACAAVLVWRLLKRLGVPGAWVAAAIWAVHPLQAESVCWISERKNVLSGLLFFGSIWFYLEAVGLTPGRTKTIAAKGASRDRSRSSGFSNLPGVSDDGTTVLLGNPRLAYWLSFLLFALSLFAKTVTCAMPAVMLVILWWKGRKLLSRGTLLPLVPFFAIGLALSAVTVYMETAAGGTVEARGPDWDLSPVQRLLIAGRAVWFYLAKLVVPIDLTFSYPRPWPSAAALGPAMYAVQWLYVIGAAAVVAGLFLARKSLGRGPLAAVLYYVLSLFPALGFFNIYPMRYSFVADHFQYLSGLGLIVLFVAAAHHAFRKLSGKPVVEDSAPREQPKAKSRKDKAHRDRANASDAAASAAAHGAGANSAGANSAGANSAGAAGVNSGIAAAAVFSWPAAIAGFVLLALSLQSWLQAHIYESPVTLWRDTLEKNPGSWMAADNLGDELITLAHEKEREAEAESMSGDADAAADSRGDARNKLDEAEKLFKRALTLRPNNILAHTSLGVLYYGASRWDDAERELRLAVDLNLKEDRPHQLTAPFIDYAILLQHTHPGADVRPWLKQAMDLEGQPRIRPADLAKAHVAWGQYMFRKAAAENKKGQVDAEAADLAEATRELEYGLRTASENTSARFDLAQAFQQLGQIARDRATALRAAGRVRDAQAWDTRAYNFYDPRALAAYKEVVADTPFGRHSGALNGMGQLFEVDQVPLRDVQFDAINDYLLSMQFFQDAAKIDARTPGVAQNLGYVVKALIQQGNEDLSHGASWEPLRASLARLKSAADAAVRDPASTESARALAAAADAAAGPVQTTTWPLQRNHPLRDPLRRLQGSIAAYQSVADPNARHPAALQASDPSRSSMASQTGAAQVPDASPGQYVTSTPFSGGMPGAELSPASTEARGARAEAMSQLQSDTAAVLDRWNDRKPQADAAADAYLAALCFGGALKADGQSADAWRGLQSASDLLAKIPPDATGISGVLDLLEQTRSTLESHRSATQPSTRPTTLPTSGG